MGLSNWHTLHFSTTLVCFVGPDRGQEYMILETGTWDAKVSCFFMSSLLPLAHVKVTNTITTKLIGTQTFIP
jgi:hypothetical protein